MGSKRWSKVQAHYLENNFQGYKNSIAAGEGAKGTVLLFGHKVITNTVCTTILLLLHTGR